MPARTLYIAGWDDRVLAWFLDIILVSVIVAGLATVIGLLSSLLEPVTYVSPTIGGNGLALFVYWTALEGYQGQSAGKMALDIAVTDERGDPIDYPTAAIESFGKAFLLPFDLVVGLLCYEKGRRRLFNKLSSTIVVEADEGRDGPPDDVQYVYPVEK